MENLSFSGNDPGATKYGNFINYYTFHSADKRTENLHPKMFPIPTGSEPYICLDIGCNTGELTNEIHNFLTKLYPQQEIYILAIDIDPMLIKRAEMSIDNPYVSFGVADIMKEDLKIIKDFLFKYKRESFDVTFCFSVTMWIHINNGDEGLIQFLKYVGSISHSIVLECQPWNCYRTAQRRLKKSGSTFPLYESLKYRSNVNTIIEDFLLQIFRKVYESPNSSWKRKIQSFHKI